MSNLEEVLTGLAEWSQKYREVTESKPEIGTILKSVDGDAVLNVELNDGQPPFIYGKASVPELTDIEPAWYLHDDNHRSHFGWKCILMPRARAELIKRQGLDGDTVKVKSLRVIKYSQSGQSILCEVNEYV